MIKELQRQADDYLAVLEAYAIKHGLELIGPIDHFAVKMADARAFDSFIDQILPLADKVHCVNLSNRRISIAFLQEAIHFGRFGDCTDIEIMEPKPEKVGRGLVGFEHIEIYRPDFNDLLGLGEFKDNGHHKSIVIKLNEEGQELKLNNSPIRDVLVKERQEGIVTYLK
jgi:hypothetical protein